MKSVLLSIPGVWLAIFATSCAGDDTGSEDSTVSVSPTGSSTTTPGATDTGSGSMPNVTGPSPQTSNPPSVPPQVGATGTTGPTGQAGPTGPTGAGMTAAPGPTGALPDPTATDMPAVPGPTDTAPVPGPTGTEEPVTPVEPGPTGEGGTPAVPTEPEPDVPDVPEPTLITSGRDAYWTVGEVTEGGTSATITVNDGQTYQEWMGFGGTFNEKGWDALSVLDEAERTRALKLLYDPVEGAAFTYGRIPIGASDYAMDRYTLAETPDDFEMNDFSIDRDLEMLIPYIHAAQEIQPNIKFWGSPWTPPPWMKDNNAYDRGYLEDDPQVMQAMSLYLIKFAQAYAEQGIPISALHPQNEPGWQQDYPSCGWSNQQMIDFIANYLGPDVEETIPGTEVWIGTMSNGDIDNSIAEAVMGNSGAAAYVKGIGLQWEMETHAQRYTSTYDVPVFQTEHKCGNYPWVGGTDQSRAPNDHAYGVETWDLLHSWITKGVHAYMAWNMVLDTVGRSLDTVRPWAQNALLAVDRNSRTLNVTPAYHVFRHVAQYVEPGAVRVGVNGDALAFKNPDGSIVTIIRNDNGSPAATTLSVGGTMLQFEVPGDGWATVNWGDQ